MKNFKSFLTLFVLSFFAVGLSLSAQDVPAIPNSGSAELATQDASPVTSDEQDGKASDEEKSSKGKEQADDKQSDDKKTDDKKTDDKKTDDKKTDDKKTDDKKTDDKKTDDKKTDDKKTDDKKADDKKADDKKADDKKADDKKADDKKADDKKADDKKAEDKKAEDKKAEDKKAEDKKADGKSQDEGKPKNKLTNPMRFNPWSRDKERIDSFSKKSDDFVSVFEPVVASADASTLRIVSGKRQIALGTVIDSDGYVLTKASELTGQLGCMLNDGTIAKARVIGIDPETDLAMLKVDAENLNVIQWSPDPTPLTGQWVATPKAEDDLPTIGVISVDARMIPPSKPFIGITMVDVPKDGGVRITSVVPKSPADSADLFVNDVILKIDEANVVNITKLREELRQFNIHDRVTLSIKRGKKELKIKLTLAERDKISPENDRSNQQNSMGSKLSRRRKDFPNSFQHDSMLSSKTCGGPIVDLSGKVVGINIARAGRVSSLALTAATVRPVIERLKSGELAPEVVNKSKIEAIDFELAEIDSKFKIDKLPESKIELERKYNVERARLEELEKTTEELMNRMKVIKEKASKYKSELDSVRKEIRSIERVRQRLEADRKQLATGSR